MVFFSGVTGFCKTGSKPAILLYEFLRIFVLCAARVGRPVAALPASWYAAAPLLALPLILLVLHQLERDHAAVYGRLYLLTKSLSTLGCLIYVVRTLVSVLSATSELNSYESSLLTFGLLVLFFLIDVILLLMSVRRKRKGGAKDASFD
jgi:hypothetical protein